MESSNLIHIDGNTCSLLPDGTEMYTNVPTELMCFDLMSLDLSSSMS